MNNKERLLNPSLEASSALIENIWRRFGGPSNISSLLEEEEISSQALVNWRFRGKVPLPKVNIVAHTLKIPKWGLNYNQLSLLYENIPPWKEVVESYGLTTSHVEDILSL